MNYKRLRQYDAILVIGVYVVAGVVGGRLTTSVVHLHGIETYPKACKEEGTVHTAALTEVKHSVRDFHPSKNNMLQTTKIQDKSRNKNQPGKGRLRKEI